MKKLLILQIAIIGIFFSCTFMGTNHHKAVLKAYDLRMNGQVDDAKALLDSVLTIDSTCAMAHYEMARLKKYMLTGGGNTSIDEVLASINNAIKYDPKNASYVYFGAIANFLQAYISMQSGNGDVKGKVEESCKQFEHVLKLDPDYNEAMLYLVDIYGMLPMDMGGNSEKAAEYAEKLANADVFLGAKAKAILSPEDMDYLQFWNDQIVLNGESADNLTELGIIYLYMEDPENAEKSFKKAIKLDQSKQIQILNLSRYHMYRVMQNQELAEAELPLANKYAEEYLAMGPNVPLKAYTLGLMSRYVRFMGNQEESAKIKEEAKELDPYYSRATGVPSLGLFIPPDQENHFYASFFGPF